MRFVIMADGKGTRWNNYMGIPKHLIEVDGEMLLARTVRLLHQFKKDNIEVIITSHDPRYEFEGARRYEPLNNEIELDRFTSELIEDDMCFLYGDTYYTEDSIKTIIEKQSEELLFFGTKKSIVAVKIQDSKIFREHFKSVKEKFLKGEISQCKGWQIYQSYVGQNLNEPYEIADAFVEMDGKTLDINTPEEYKGI